MYNYESNIKFIFCDNTNNKHLNIPDTKELKVNTSYTNKLHQ